MMILNHGYQYKDNAIGAISVKVRYILAFKLRRNICFQLKGIGTSGEEGEEEIFDSSDLVYPAIENGAIFLTTSMVNTPGQQKTTCADPKRKCQEDSDCPTKKKSTGIFTGKCLTDEARCEVKSWCPMESKESESASFDGIEDWTVFIKTNVVFPYWNVAAYGNSLIPWKLYHVLEPTREGLKGLERE